MQKFDESKLRDPHLRAAFYKKLAEIRSIQRKHTFIDYATNQHLFDELLAIYEKNIEQYESYYLQNCQAYEQARQAIDAQKDKVHPSRFAEMLGLRKQIEDCLQSENYSDNQQASAYIRDLSTKLEVYLEEMELWREELLQMEVLLESAKNEVWEEDLIQFRQVCHRLKNRVLGDQLPAQREQSLPVRLNEAKQARSTAFTNFLERLHAFPKLQARVALLKNQSLSYQTFEKLQSGLALIQQLRKWIVAGVASLALMGVIWVGMEAPGWVYQYLLRREWEQTKQVNSYDEYQDFIDRYKEGGYVIAAKEAQAQLQSGKISIYRDPAYGEFSYEGQLREGKPHGEGVGRFASGGEYVGNWANGQFHGQGKWLDGQGEGYEGEWIRGLKEGKGSYHYKDGTTYTGMWKANMPKGKGTRILTDSSRYTGLWKNGKLEGGGSWRDEAGNRYEGAWLKGKFHGKGTYSYADGSTYSGQWIAGVKQGSGVFTWKDGRSYSGEWTQNSPHGKGIMRWENGAVFVGSWKNGVIAGKGSFTSRFRELYEGTFIQDSTGFISLYNDGDSLVLRGKLQGGLLVKDTR